MRISQALICYQHLDSIRTTSTTRSGDTCPRDLASSPSSAHSRTGLLPLERRSSLLRIEPRSSTHACNEPAAKESLRDKNMHEYDQVSNHIHTHQDHNSTWTFNVTHVIIMHIATLVLGIKRRLFRSFFVPTAKYRPDKHGARFLQHHSRSTRPSQQRKSPDNARSILLVLSQS